MGSGKLCARLSWRTIYLTLYFLLGDKEFEKSAFEKFDRSEKKLSIGWKRVDDQDPIFNPIEKVIWEFEQKIGMAIEELDISTHVEKRLRGELLIRLKDTA